jgi:hypothetical protein
VGNSHLGETDEQRTAAVKAVRQVCETNVPTLIQGADSLHQVRVACGVRWLNKSRTFESCSTVYTLFVVYTAHATCSGYVAIYSCINSRVKYHTTRLFVLFVDPAVAGPGRGHGLH